MDRKYSKQARKRYSKRVRKHYKISKAMLIITKFVFYRYVADKSIVELRSNTNERSKDRYVYCKSNMKNFCPIGGTADYTLYIGGGHGYSFYGNCELECYMTAVMKFYKRSPLNFPRDKKMTKD